MSTTNQYPDFSGLTFEKIWALMQENERKNNEAWEKYREEVRVREERQQRENAINWAAWEAKIEQEKAERIALGKEHERDLAETKKMLSKSLAEANQAIGRLGNRFGEAMERLVRPGVADKFNELGYRFDGESHNLKIKDPKTGNRLTELDIILENGESVVVVEIKVNPDNDDVEHLTEQLQHYREFRNRLNPNDHKKIFGAIAAAVFPDHIQKVALDLGYYVIVPSGENIKIVVPENVELKAF